MKCGICKKDLKIIKNFGRLPFSNNLVNSENEKTEKFKLELSYCKNCDLLQLSKKLDSKILFKKSYPYKSGVSKFFIEHCKEFAEKFTYREKMSILEIGGNDGTLAKEIVKAKPESTVCIIDPCSPKSFDIENIYSIRDLFSKKIVTAINGKTKFNAIIFQNSFAHLPNPKETINGCYPLLSTDGLVIIELPVAEYSIKNNFWETVYFEHQFYWTETALIKFMNSVGLYFSKLERFPNIQGGSTRFYFTNRRPEKELKKELKKGEKIKIQELKKSILNFGKRQTHVKKFIRSVPEGERVIGITAPAKAANLLYLLDKEEINRIEFIVDDTPSKQNKFLACHKRNIPIKSFEHLPTNAYCLILSKNYEFLFYEKLKPFNPRIAFCP